MSAHRTPPVTENDSPDGVKVDLATAAAPATTCVIPGLQHGDRGGDCRRCKPLSWTSRPSPREREGSAFPLAWAHIKNRPTTTRPWKTTGHQGLPALPIGGRVTPKILLTASRTSAKPDRTSAVLDSTQVARTFEATPHCGGSLPSAISVRRLARSQQCDGCHFFQNAHCGNSCPLLAVLQQLIRLAISCANLFARLFAP